MTRRGFGNEAPTDLGALGFPTCSEHLLVINANPSTIIITHVSFASRVLYILVVGMVAMIDTGLCVFTRGIDSNDHHTVLHRGGPDHDHCQSLAVLFREMPLRREQLTTPT